MALLDWLFQSVPLWLLGFFLLLVLATAFRIGVWLRSKGRHGDDRTDDEGYLLSAALALLGLLIAFTFSLALDRYDARRALVVQEANAIGTAWLRAGLAEGEAGQALQHQVAAYADIRLKLPHSVDESEALNVEQRTSRAQATLWRQMKVAMAAMQPPIAATLVTAMNDMFDLASSRKAERAAHIPSDVLAVLVLCTAMSAAIIGYVLGSTSRSHRTITSILFVLLTLALLLILDLDRPWNGAVIVSQQPMIDARAAMD